MPYKETSTVAPRSNDFESFRISDRSDGPERSVGTVENALHFALATNIVGSDTNPSNLVDHSERGQSSVHNLRSRDAFSSIENLPRTVATFIPIGPSLHPLQEWEGYVVEIAETEFSARLTDLTANSTCEGEEATFPLDEISEDDASRLRVGSIFRWVIGYERSVAGTKKRVSQIVFRDLPVITKTDIRDGEAWAQETIESLGL